MPTFTGTTVPYELNRLAGTLGPNGEVLCDAAKAANIWAGTSNLDLDGALAAKAGGPGVKGAGSANALAGTTNLEMAAALALIGGTFAAYSARTWGSLAGSTWGSL